MNRERAKELLPVIQAFAEGRTVQHKEGETWFDAENLNFDDYPTRYRIKPERRKVWVHFPGDHSEQMWLATFPPCPGGCEKIGCKVVCVEEPD